MWFVIALLGCSVAEAFTENDILQKFAEYDNAIALLSIRGKHTTDTTLHQMYVNIRINNNTIVIIFLFRLRTAAVDRTTVK